MDQEFKRQRAQTVRDLADKATDPFTKKRLQDLAARYEGSEIPPAKLTPTDQPFTGRGMDPER